jgi:hypothetical protein
MTSISKGKSKNVVVDTEHAMVVVEAPPTKQNEGTGPTKILKQAAKKKAPKVAKAPKAPKEVAPADTKKSKAKKAKLAEAARERTSWGGYEADARIIVIAKENPGREGTKRHGWFATYQEKGMTVGKFVATVEPSDLSNALGYLKNDVEKRKLIRIAE